MQPRHERLRRLIEPVHDRARTFARGLSRSRADGDDLFQEAVVRALEKLDGLRDDGAFRSWLYRVIISVHRNRARRAFWRRLLPLGEHAGEEAAAPAPDDELGGAERARLALASLSTEQREAIVLFEIEGWQVDEIARLQGASVSAVKSRLSRGRDHLRAFYVRRFGAVQTTSSLIPGETR
jgi:RNA polymerase sigma-70 factor, ECF subfamily